MLSFGSGNRCRARARRNSGARILVLVDPESAPVEGYVMVSPCHVGSNAARCQHMCEIDPETAHRCANNAPKLFLREGSGLFEFRTPTNPAICVAMVPLMPNQSLLGASSRSKATCSRSAFNK
jgi:hypothetical protein